MHTMESNEPSCGSLTSQDIKDGQTSNSGDFFDLNLVVEHFQKCKRGDDIYLDEYLRGYIELNKFFQLLGNIFNFVASDVQKKVTILQCYRKGGAGDFYFTIKSMIDYEKDSDLLNSAAQQSGSRTLLRLHRALEFIIEFLKELGKAEDETKLGSTSAEIYNCTLAKYHGWIIVKTVSTLLYLMPTKKVIIDKVTRGDNQIRLQNEAALPQVIEVMISVYSITQKLYEDNDILNLP